MKSLFVLMLIIVTSTSWGFNEDGNYSSGSEIESAAGCDGVVTVTELNTWSVPEGTTAALGLDYIPHWYEPHVIAYACAGDRVYYMSADDGSIVLPGGWTLDGNNTFPFGVCLVTDPDSARIHVNDFSYDGMFMKYYAVPWVEYGSLTDLMGRGLDYHAGMDKIFDLYTIQTPGDFRWLVAMFTPGQAAGSTYELDCNIGSDWTASGCCVYPMLNGNTGIAVTMYESSWIRFFEYPGHAGEQFYSHGILPYSVDSSYGLTYADEKDTFFHSYQSGGLYYISELQVSGVHLERDTWASIKSSF